ncbi:MAG: hypothetical protein GY858_02950 [Candidatus Omnitrophica bacterium]|nr:hypothetical protein [Candidatus Omnitrophota bacterium]
MRKIVLMVFIEEFEEFQSFIKERRLEIGDFCIVAVSGKLQAHLKKLKVDFRNVLNYFGNDSYKRILLKLNEMYEYIGEHFNFTDTNGVKNAYLTELQRYTEVMFNYIAKILEILQSICDRDNHIELYACKKKYTKGSIFGAISTGLLVKKFADKHKIKFHYFGDSQECAKKGFTGTQENASAMYNFSLDLLKAYLKVFNKVLVVLPTLSYGFKVLVDKVKFKNSHSSFLILKDDKRLKWYQRYGGLIWGLFSGVFFIDINFVQSRDSSIDQAGVTKSLEKLFDDECESVFTYNGVNVKQVMDQKRSVFVGRLRQMVEWSYKFKALTQKFNIVLLISPFGRGLWYVAAELLPKLDRPSLFISHGTHPMPINQYHEISIFNLCRGFMLGDYSHVALSTPVQQEHFRYFKNKYEWIKNKEVLTAPLIFADITETDKFTKKAHLSFLPDEQVILHATTVKPIGSERFYFLETVDEYLSGLADVVGAINKMDNTKLIIRVHPGFDLSDEEMKLFLPESSKYSISRLGKFEDVLSASDMLISYSSTVIDEALINRIPVLLYDKWDRYNHFKTGVFNNYQSPDIFPVCYVNSKDKSYDAINFMLSRLKGIKKKDIDVSRFRYEEDNSSNFYNFIRKSLQ